MAQPALLRLMADAPPALCLILNPAREAILPPIRSEIFGLQHFADHGRSLAQSHRVKRANAAFHH